MKHQCPIHHIDLICPGCIGRKTSKAKARASRANGKLGGRPKKQKAGAK